MSSYVRPRHKFNRQICQDIAVKLGRNQYGLANQEPNNPIYYTLASIKKGISDGAFMKTTITGTKLPNPIKQLKAFAGGSSSGGGGKNPPAPRIPAGANTFVARQNENVAQNNAVRRQARQQLRQQLRGRIAVAQRPNVIRRQVQFQPAPEGDGPPALNRRRRVVRGMGKKDAPRKVRKGLGMTDEETRAFTYSPYKEKPETTSEVVEEGSEKAKEVRSFFEDLLNDAKKDKVSTPA